MFLRGFRDLRLSTPPGETGGVMVGVPGSSISGIVKEVSEKEADRSSSVIIGG